MKSVRLKMDVKNRLDEFGNGLSNNKAMKLLLEDAEEFDIKIDSSKDYYNIKIDDDLLDKLNRCRMYSGESHSDIVSRLLDSKLK